MSKSSFLPRMNKIVIMVFGFAMALLIAICQIQNEVYAQSQPTAVVSNKTSINGSGVVSVSTKRSNPSEQ